MTKIKTAKVKETNEMIEVYQSSTWKGKYINADDCKTMYSEKDIIILGDAQPKPNKIY